MMRLLLCLALVAIVAPGRAWADDPPPTQAELDAAKKAYEEGKALYTAGKLTEAIAKLEESYRLSHNAFLLYNIGLAYDHAGQKDKAQLYYLKFLQRAPANAPMRDDVKNRVDALEKENAEPDPATAATTTTTTVRSDLEHQVIDSATPGKPLELTVVVPPGSTFTVTLFYRGTDEATFTSLPMQPRDTVRVGTIPGDRIKGAWIQYYVEVRDPAGKLVKRWGKSLSPNLVNVGAAAPTTGPEPEDPLRDVLRTEQPAPPSRSKAKWVAGGTSLVLIAGTTAMYFVAKSHSDKLREDLNSCGMPPCRVFDASYDQKTEADGVRDNTIYQVGLGISVAAIAVTGYLWYRDAKAKRPPALALVPAVTTDFAGATVVAGF